MILKFTVTNCNKILNDIKEAYARYCHYVSIINYPPMGRLTNHSFENPSLPYALYLTSYMTTDNPFPSDEEIFDKPTLTSREELMVMTCRIYNALFAPKRCELEDIVGESRTPVSRSTFTMTASQALAAALRDLAIQWFPKGDDIGDPTSPRAMLEAHAQQPSVSIAYAMEIIGSLETQLKQAQDALKAKGQNDISKEQDTLSDGLDMSCETKESVRQETFLEVIQQAREYALADCSTTDVHTLQAFLHRLPLTPELRKLVQSITAKDNKWDRLIAAIENTRTYNIAKNFGPIGAPIERQINSFGQQPNKQISQQQ